MRLRSTLVTVSLASLAACHGSPAAQLATVRLNPWSYQGSPQVAVQPLFDRDTTTAFQPTGAVTLTLAFRDPVDVRAVKLFGAQSLRVSGEGFSSSSPGGAGWVSLPVSGVHGATQYQLTLAPTGPGASLAEVEIWGAGLPEAPRNPAVLAQASLGPQPLPYENAVVEALSPGAATLQPAGTACAYFNVATPLPLLPALRRAYLVYEANSVQRPVVLARSLNAAAPEGGFWLQDDEQAHEVVDELDPRKLTGADALTLCVPPQAASTVNVADLRLVLLLDDGTNLLDRDAAQSLGAAFDGDPETAQDLLAGRLELGLERPTAIDGAALLLDSPTAQLASVGFFSGQGWTELPGDTLTDTQLNALPLNGQLAQAFELTFAPQPLPGLPAASVDEILTSGSGVGPLVALPRLVVTYPPLTYDPSTGYEIGERFGTQAYVEGWAESPAGVGVVTVQGAAASDPAGAFGVALQEPDGLTGTWAVTLQAQFPDGTTLSRTIHLDDDESGNLGGAAAGAGSSGSDDQLYGSENQTSWGTVSPQGGGTVKLGSQGASVSAPPGAVSSPTQIGITRKGPEAVPPLDPGMVNVTAPGAGAYRFSPPGQTFAVPVKVTLPYDPALLPDGYAPEQIATYFYDEGLQHWTALPTVAVSRGGRQVTAQTTHFTFMINAVLVEPDHPGPTSFNPTSLKDLKAADPSANVDMIEAPGGNNQGSARLSFPIRLPRARGGYQPTLALTYDSTRGNGWLGVGWDLSISSIEIDTRFGVPRYTGDERYLLDGQQLVPLPSPLDGATCAQDGGTREYVLRSERDFKRILRCGADPTSYHWEVTDKSGNLFVYGAAGATLASYLIGQNDAANNPIPAGIGKWMLQRVIDRNGNGTEIVWTEDEKSSAPAGPFVAQSSEDFRQVYPSTINYASKGGSTSTPLSPVSGGPYLVSFIAEPSERPDVVTSARLGFKVATRLRLGAIRVQLGDQIIREYVLAYGTGDFGKSLLSSIAVYGEGGAQGGQLFYSHGLSYTQRHNPQAGVVPPEFGSQPQSWSIGDSDALTKQTQTSGAANVAVGIAVGPVWESGGVGIQGGLSGQVSQTTATLIDINGDGLPDRVAQSSPGAIPQVSFNDPTAQTMSLMAPAWDPAASQPAIFLQPPRSLGAETGDAFNFGVLGDLAGIQANIGGAYDWSNNQYTLIDFNGDGLVDVAGEGNVWFNQIRAAGKPSFDFSQSSPLETIAPALSFLADGGDQAFFADAGAQQHGTEDALLQWVAPFSGDVVINGSLALLTPQSPPLPGQDGVHLRIVKSDNDVYSYQGKTNEQYGDKQLFETDKAPDDPSATAISIPVTVQQGDQIYFQLSTKANFPISDAGTPLEGVSFAPDIAYVDGGSAYTVDPSLVDPTGAKVFDFNEQSDFKVAGDFSAPVTVPAGGTLTISGQFVKKPSSDEICSRIKCKWSHQDSSANLSP